MKRDREKDREQLRERENQSRETKDDGVFGFSSYFTVPEGVDIWYPKYPSKVNDSEQFQFDIVPFVAGDNYPTRIGKGPSNVKAGHMVYVLDVWIHKNVGPENLQTVCPLKTYGLRCPICEHGQDLLADEDDKGERKKIVKEKFPKRRVMYNVIVRDGGEEEDKGIQVFEFSHYWMEKELQNLKDLPDNRNVFYADPIDGRTIWFKLTKTGTDKMENGPYTFIERDYEITEEELDEAVCLDELLIPHSYDEIRDLYWGVDAEEEAVEEENENVDEPGNSEPPSRLIRKRDMEEPVEEEEEESEESEEPEGGCPINLRWGYDHNEYENCDTCDKYDDCGAEKERIKKAEQAKKRKKAEAAKPIRKPKPRARGFKRGEK